MDIEKKEGLEKDAKQQTINVRHALFGSRTEAFATYCRTTGSQQMHYRDVVSLYPTVNAMGDYAVDYADYVKTTPEEIASGEFFGMVKLDMIPPTDLRIPVLPDNSKGKLLFHLMPTENTTFTSIEVKTRHSRRGIKYPNTGYTPP